VQHAFRSFTRKRKEEFVAVGIGDADHVIAPPRFLGRHRALRELPAKLIEAIRGQRHKQPAFVSAHGIFTQDDFALSTVDLTDGPLAVGFMSSFFETQLVEVKAEGALHVGHDGLDARRSEVIKLDYRIHYETGLFVGDFNGDGRPDLAVFGYTLTGVGWDRPPAAYIWLQPARKNP
jgi:hypothetical protein